jgi:hypothetical protein
VRASIAVAFLLLQLAFAMQIRLPNNAPFGANGLLWALDPFGGRGPQVNARVTVDR